jgi:peptidoglycan/LPS O-acetylase OafA/YrhL
MAEKDPEKDPEAVKNGKEDIDELATEPKTSALPPFAYRPALDGVRGLAAMAVVLFHADTPGFGRGYAGVDVFFVLTGFLMCSLLIRELADHRRLEVTGVFFRRARRLLPLSLVVLIVTAIAHKIFSNPLTVMEHRMSFVASSLYHANIRMLIDSHDYFATDKISPVQHYWSLSNEEVLSFTHSS